MELMVIQPRSCGECRACCTVLGVRELEKPNYQRCDHECAKGCAIYASRPQTCRDYYCMWAQGLIEGDERRRPDKLGVVFDLNVTLDGSFVRAWEVWPGARQNSAAHYLLEKTIAKKRWDVQVMWIDRALGEKWNLMPDTAHEMIEAENKRLTAALEPQINELIIKTTNLS